MSEENIRYIGELRHVPPRRSKSVGIVISRCSTWTASTERRADQLSGGMKQKLALGARWWRNRRCCCWTSQPPVWIPFRAANSGIRSPHLAMDGLTILVATPYLDEAERCHRVALMHLGEIQRSARPRNFAGSSACGASSSTRALWAKRRKSFLNASGPGERHRRRPAFRRSPRRDGPRR